MSNLDWCEIDDPVMEIDGFIDVILDKTDILDLLDMWGMEYSVCRTGEFTHKLKCPLPQHFFGEERTASFFISEDQNNFYCFGCNSGGNSIDLIKLYSGKPYHESAKWLADFAGLTSNNIGDIENIVKKKRDPEHRISTHIFRIGVEIRKHLNNMKEKQEYKKWCDWADKRFLKLDKYLEQLDDDDWEIVKNYHNKIVNYLKSKS